MAPDGIGATGRQFRQALAMPRHKFVPKAERHLTPQVLCQSMPPAKEMPSTQILTLPKCPVQLRSIVKVRAAAVF